MLSQYITDTQDMLNDSEGQFFRDAQLTRYINRARRRIAAASGCIRVMPPATRTFGGQEAYPFSMWTSTIQSMVPGVQSILHCRSLAVAIGVGGWKPMWRRIVWTDFQARFRIFNGTFIGTISEPGWWAQFGSGPAGQIFLAPIPSQECPMDVDLTCVPEPLLRDEDPEPIPYPWTDAVPYWTAVLCLLQQQRKEDATAMAQLFNAELPFCASVVCPHMIQTAYGATIRSA
jgi:hypothetical protein